MKQIKCTIILLLAFSGLSALAQAQQGPWNVDIACDGSTFTFHGQTNENGAPTTGTNFIVIGYIYPDGFFAEHGSNAGVLPDGGPSHPELMIGKWICRGTSLRGYNDGLPPSANTTQFCDFDVSMPGAEMLISEGFEYNIPGVPYERAIVGGTGRYRFERGSVTQMIVNANATGFANFMFTLRPATLRLKAGEK